jgi:hypothetical protein
MVNSWVILGLTETDGSPKLVNFNSSTTLDLEDLAGVQIMRTASGERLKSQPAYHKGGSSMEFTITNSPS